MGTAKGRRDQTRIGVDNLKWWWVNGRTSLRSLLWRGTRPIHTGTSYLHHRGDHDIVKEERGSARHGSSFVAPVEQLMRIDGMPLHDITHDLPRLHGAVLGHAHALLLADSERPSSQARPPDSHPDKPARTERKARALT
ncbi:hypothetical protein VDGL01_08824 [Verticillium dahliae]